ncbi:Nucleolar protein 4 [Fragariocoptes setiger]|uniref:Nucleolar protein 4 n=1 Tax=Fragariocoptes setiger TaxID=1670756 RepID=A0ABQ7S7B8_9ACAR|nr:Nucleolar protein 4 [Fragariocoptes setiger]
MIAEAMSSEVKMRSRSSSLSSTTSTLASTAAAANISRQPLIPSNNNNYNYQHMISTERISAPTRPSLNSHSLTTPTSVITDDDEVSNNNGSVNNMCQLDTSSALSQHQHQHNSNNNHYYTSQKPPTTSLAKQVLGSLSGADKNTKATKCCNPSKLNNKLVMKQHALDPASLEAFKKWAKRAYGDLSKTKTITRNKYAKIVDTLTAINAANNGAEGANYHGATGAHDARTTMSSDAVFRFWVESKGFVLLPDPSGSGIDSSDESSQDEERRGPRLALFVAANGAKGDDYMMSTGHTYKSIAPFNNQANCNVPMMTNPNSSDTVAKRVNSIGSKNNNNNNNNLQFSVIDYYGSTHTNACDVFKQSKLKRVAIVEDFHKIIASVHVKIIGTYRHGKHAGQKRTFQAIAQQYAFLPREAVTKFLMSCADCRKRMRTKHHLSSSTSSSSCSAHLRSACHQHAHRHSLMTIGSLSSSTASLSSSGGSSSSSPSASIASLSSSSSSSSSGSSSSSSSLSSGSASVSPLSSPITSSITSSSSHPHSLFNSTDHHHHNHRLAATNNSNSNKMSPFVNSMAHLNQPTSASLAAAAAAAAATATRWSPRASLESMLAANFARPWQVPGIESQAVNQLSLINASPQASASASASSLWATGGWSLPQHQQQTDNRIRQADRQQAKQSLQWLNTHYNPSATLDMSRYHHQMSPPQAAAATAVGLAAQARPVYPPYWQSLMMDRSSMMATAEVTRPIVPSSLSTATTAPTSQYIASSMMGCSPASAQQTSLHQQQQQDVRHLTDNQRNMMTAEDLMSQSLLLRQYLCRSSAANSYAAAAAAAANNNNHNNETSRATAGGLLRNTTDSAVSAAAGALVSNSLTPIESETSPFNVAAQLTLDAAGAMDLTRRNNNNKARTTSLIVSPPHNAPVSYPVSCN